MLLRSRPDGSAAASRVAALMPVREGGWVPPPETAPEVSPPEEVRQPAEVDLPRVEEQDPADRSWAARGPGAHLATPGRYRLDPGHRGAAALVLTALLAALVAGGVALRNRPQEVPLPVVEEAGVPLPGASSAPAAGAEVVVAVSGKVRRPGLVRLPFGSRVDDAVRAAGGPIPGTDVGMLNVARRLVDGEQVLVGVAAPASAAGAEAAQTGGLLDLNAASASDLDALPGIGPVLAQRIVDWRTENIRFASVDQLREVTGIGEAKYADLKAKVTV